MKIYLDLCVYNRPFDDQTQRRIALETMAFLILLELAINGDLVIIGSFALDYENSRNPLEERRYMIKDLFSVSTKHVDFSKEIEERASAIENTGIAAMDALHIACAESAGSDIFVTCDDTLIRKVRPIHDKFKIKTANILDFISEEVL